jgi:hypothetical protein
VRFIDFVVCIVNIISILNAYAMPADMVYIAICNRNVVVAVSVSINTVPRSICFIWSIVWDNDLRRLFQDRRW